MNPILPLNEYIPDVEAHVFDGRVYLYGSHDRADGKRFCERDYTVYSSEINDLKHWKGHGISYAKKEDPHSQNEKEVDFYAPDCVKGNDGRYYLYYVAMGPNTKNFGPISVAVADLPEGPFHYYGDVRYENGEIVKDFLTNDPTVLNDEGRICLYYGWGLGRDFRNRLLKPLYDFVLSKITLRSLKQIRESDPCILSCAFAELKEDMLTVKERPKAVLDAKTSAKKGTPLYDHPFYEAPSIRKIGDLYYLVYSSGENNELAYAVSKYPDHGFEYWGVIISNADLGYEGNRTPMNNASTIHGSIECIDGQYYVFYHRSTNNTDYSRQVCMEKIDIDEDGTIRQVRMTSSGIDGTLPAKGEYSAAICCNLVTEKRIPLGLGRQQSLPRIGEKEGELRLLDLKKGTKVFYRYFDTRTCQKMRVDYTGNALIEVNGIRLDEKNEMRFLEKEEYAEIGITVLEGSCDIRSLIFE